MLRMLTRYMRHKGAIRYRATDRHREEQMQASCYLQECKLLSAWAVQQQCCQGVLACLLIAQRQHVTNDKATEPSRTECQCVTRVPACGLTYWDLWGSRQGSWVSRRGWWGNSLHMHSDLSIMCVAGMLVYICAVISKVASPLPQANPQSQSTSRQHFGSHHSHWHGSAELPS